MLWQHRVRLHWQSGAVQLQAAGLPLLLCGEDADFSAATPAFLKNRVLVCGALPRQAQRAPAAVTVLCDYPHTLTGYSAAVRGVPVLMAYWFAPALAGWWKLPAPKAMFFSFYACLRNWRPFVAYALGLAIFAGVLPGLVVAVLGLLSPTLGSLAALPVPLIVLPIVFASFYTATRDVFGLPENNPARDPVALDDARDGD